MLHVLGGYYYKRSVDFLVMLQSLLYGIVNGNAFYGFSASSGSDPCENFRPVFKHFLARPSSFGSGYSLDEYLCFFVDKNWHKIIFLQSPPEVSGPLLSVARPCV